MKWKKNILSHIIWFVYVLLVCAALLGQVETLGVLLEGIEVQAAIGALAAAGTVALLFHLFARKDRIPKEGGANTCMLAEAALAVLFLILGLVLRIRLLPDAGEQAMYFESAKVAEGQTIPQIVHGATYVYLMLLRGFFLFFGNKMSAAVWLQIVIWFLAALLLFVGIRKLAGALPALLVLLYSTCSEFAVQDTVRLSPRIMFLFLLALGIAALSACKTKKLHPFLYLPCGMLVGVIVCLDAGGVLLVIIGVAAVFSEWDQKPGGMERAGAALLFLAGCLAGFWGLLCADAFFSQSPFIQIVYAWFMLYQPGAFHIFLSIGEGISPWGILLVMLSLTGIFSYWWDGHYERMSVWTLAAGVAAAAECFGLLTEELPASLYLFLSFSVMAGVGVQGCFRKEPEIAMSDENMNKPDNELEETKQPGEEAKEPGETKQPEREVQEPKEVEKIQLIENPLPLPRSHKRRALDFDRSPGAGEEDYDLVVDENDDYDIK